MPGVKSNGPDSMLTLTPSEYVQRNCFFATELTPFDSGMIDFMGPEHIMWGSDYPHEEGFSPHSKLAIRWALHDRSADACRKILGSNAARLYGFDLEALAPDIERVGFALDGTGAPDRR